MLLVIRLFWLTLEAVGMHFQNGLAYPTLILAALIGWRGWRIYWLAPLIIIPAAFAAQLYADATGRGKLPGAMSNVIFECGVFALLALLAFAAGRAVLRR